MKLKKLDKFYREIQTIEIKSERLEDETHLLTVACDRSYRILENQLYILKESALTEILSLPKEQILFNIARLNILNHRNNSGWESLSKYVTNYRVDKVFDINDFLKEMNRFLIITIPDSQDFITNSYDFLRDFYNVFNAKRSLLINLVISILNITELKYKAFEHDVEEESKVRKLAQSLNTYLWINKDSDIELPLLYELLNGEYITDTKLVDFVAVFGEPVPNDWIPVKWSCSASELLYFITKLSEWGLIDKTQRMNYIRLKACFVKPDNALFKENFKSLNQGLDIDLSQQKKDSIEKILANFL